MLYVVSRMDFYPIDIQYYISNNKVVNSIYRIFQYEINIFFIVEQISFPMIQHQYIIWITKKHIFKMLNYEYLMLKLTLALLSKLVIFFDFSIWLGKCAVDILCQNKTDCYEKGHSYGTIHLSRIVFSLMFTKTNFFLWRKFELIFHSSWTTLYTEFNTKILTIDKLQTIKVQFIYFYWLITTSYDSFRCQSKVCEVYKR